MEGEFKLNSSGSQVVKLPRFLQDRPGQKSLSCRPHLILDEKINLGQDLDARDTAHRRPCHRNKVYKKVRRALAEAEGLKDCMEKKNLDLSTIQRLENVLNSLSS